MGASGLVSRAMISGKKFFGKVILWLVLLWIGAILLFYLGMMLMPLLPIFRDSKVLVFFTNQSKSNVAVKVEVLDLDTNKTYFRGVPPLSDVAPNETRTGAFFLDGFTPEGCLNIRVSNGVSAKTYDCGRPKDSNTREWTVSIHHE